MCTREFWAGKCGLLPAKTELAATKYVQKNKLPFAISAPVVTGEAGWE